MNQGFVEKIKGFVVWYGWLLTILILSSILTITPQPLPLDLSLILLGGFGATTLLTVMSVRWFEKAIPLSIPAYIGSIHILLLYTGGVDSPYQYLYLFPLILASLFLGYGGGIATCSLIAVSHLILKSIDLTDLPIYLLSQHFIREALPFLTLAILLAMISAFIGETLRKEWSKLHHLFVQVERAKKEWEASFDAIKDMISIHSPEYRVIRANRAVAKRLGTRVERIMGKKCYEIYHGTDSPIPNCPLLRTLETGEAETIEIEEPLLNGTFEITTYPIFDERGRLQSTVHCMKEITVQKAMEYALKRELEITRALYKTSMAILSQKDKTKIINLCLGNLKDLLGIEYISVTTAAREEEKYRFVITHPKMDPCPSTLP